MSESYYESLLQICPKGCCLLSSSMIDHFKIILLKKACCCTFFWTEENIFLRRSIEVIWMRILTITINSFECLESVSSAMIRWWLHMLKLSEFRANGEILNHKLILYQWYTRNSKYNVEYFLQRNLQNWKLTIKLILRCFGLSVYHFSCLTVLYLSTLCHFYSYWKQQCCIRSLET